MADVCTFTPAGGSAVNLNDRSKTFVRYEINTGAKKTEFDEVRSYTGAIRMLDVHQPMVEMTVPLKVVGTGSSDSGKAADLRSTLDTICTACVAGGTFVWQPSGESSHTFTVGPSPEPDIVEDALYKLRHIALIELRLKRLP